MLAKVARAIGNPTIIRRKLRLYRELLTKKREIERAKKYFTENKLGEVLGLGDANEFPPVVFDLVNLHREIRRRKSRCVLEFGVGFSTIVMCDALHKNAVEGRREGRLWVVDASKHWIENTCEKMPEHLQKYCEFTHSRAEVSLYNGELCHTFENLPDISPDLIYLDGPGGDDVEGDYKGLGFKTVPYKRTVVSADVLFYESTIAKGSRFLLIVDGRYNNVQFLKRNLKRKYIVKEFAKLKYSTFELLE